MSSTSASPACEEHLKSKYLVFETNCDGDPDTYLTGLATTIPQHLDAIWSHCVGYPGAANLPELLHLHEGMPARNNLLLRRRQRQVAVPETLRALANPTSRRRLHRNSSGHGTRAACRPTSNNSSPKLKAMPIPEPGSMAPAPRHQDRRSTMSKLNETDIQGFVLRGYNMPFARYLFLHFEDAPKPAISSFRLHRVRSPQASAGTTASLKAPSTSPSPIADSPHSNSPIATLLSFPVEFQQGMKRTRRNPRRHRRQRSRAMGRALARRTASTHGSASTPSHPRRSTPAALNIAVAHERNRRRDPPRLAGRGLRSSIDGKPATRNTSASPMASAIPTTSVSSAAPNPDRAS